VEKLRINCNYLGFPSGHIYKDGKCDLEFSESELIHASYTVGKTSWEEVHSNPYYSEQEVNFRISMVKAFLNIEDLYIKRSVNFEQLDPSEKVSINYFLGMVFSSLVMQKRFQVRWMIHLDLFEGKKDYLVGNKRPDFIGKKLSSSWNLIEAKGVQVRKSSTIEKAKEQLVNLVSIDGFHPDYKLISILYGKGEADLTIDIIDPVEKGDIELETSGVDYVSDYYASVINILKKEYSIKEIKGRKFIVKDIKCNNLFLGLDLFIFEEIQTKSLDGMNDNVESYLKENDDNRNKMSAFEENFFIGADGVYVECY